MGETIAKKLCHFLMANAKLNADADGIEAVAAAADQNR